MELLGAQRRSTGPAQAALLGLVGWLPWYPVLAPRVGQEPRAPRAPAGEAVPWRDVFLPRLGWERLWRRWQQQLVVLVEGRKALLGWAGLGVRQEPGAAEER